MFQFPSKNFSIINATLKVNHVKFMLMWLPSGTYRNTYRISDVNDDNIATVTTWSEAFYNTRSFLPDSGLWTFFRSLCNEDELSKRTQIISNMFLKFVTASIKNNKIYFSLNINHDIDDIYWALLSGVNE